MDKPPGINEEKRNVCYAVFLIPGMAFMRNTVQPGLRSS